jgi:hypothetical protein
MTEDQFIKIITKLEEIKSNSNYKGHFLIIILLLALLIKAAC